MNVKSAITDIVNKYQERQNQIEPFIGKDANASDVYEQLEIQKILFEGLELGEELSIQEKDMFSEHLVIFQETMTQTQEFVTYMKEMYGPH